MMRPTISVKLVSDAVAAPTTVTGRPKGFGSLPVTIVTLAAESPADNSPSLGARNGGSCRRRVGACAAPRGAGKIVIGWTSGFDAVNVNASVICFGRIPRTCMCARLFFS